MILLRCGIISFDLLMGEAKTANVHDFGIFEPATKRKKQDFRNYPIGDIGGGIGMLRGIYLLSAI